jgi:hypothetical protein
LAQTGAAADLVLIVNFTSAPDGSGGRVKMTALEPTQRFRQEMDGSDTPEVRDMRRRLREIEAWASTQNRDFGL